MKVWQNSLRFGFLLGCVMFYIYLYQTQIGSIEINKLFYKLFINAESLDDANKPKKRFPSIIGIGVMKCGTGGTIEFLNQHPLVKLPNVSEYELFFFNHHIVKGQMERYRNTFPLLKPNEITAEKTPEYFDNMPINLPHMIHKYLPKVKIMLNVCDPVDRAFSNFVHRSLNKQMGMHIYKTFDEYIMKFLPIAKRMMEFFASSGFDDLEIEQKLNLIYRRRVPEMQIHVLTKGLYYYHMLRWLKSFDRSEILIIDGEEFLTNPGKVMEDLQDFIGIPRLLLKENFVKNNKTNFYCYRKMEEKHFSNSTPLDDDQLGVFCLGKDKGRTRNNVRRASNKSMELLTKFYEPYNKKFFELLGRNFNWRKLP